MVEGPVAVPGLCAKRHWHRMTHAALIAYLRSAEAPRAPFCPRLTRVALRHRRSARLVVVSDEPQPDLPGQTGVTLDPSSCPLQPLPIAVAGVPVGESCRSFDPLDGQDVPEAITRLQPDFDSIRLRRATFFDFGRRRTRMIGLCPKQGVSRAAAPVVQ